MTSLNELRRRWALEESDRTLAKVVAEEQDAEELWRIATADGDHDMALALELEGSVEADPAHSNAPPCGICLEQCEGVVYLQCDHCFCKGCLLDGANADLDVPRPPQCPSCLADRVVSPVNLDGLRSLGMDPARLQVAERFEIRRALEADVDVTTCEYCDMPSLPALLPNPGSLCPYCAKDPAGRSKDAALAESNGVAQASLDTYRRENRVIDCQKCGHGLELRDACNKLQCTVCKCMNCWFCGLEIHGDPYEHFGEGKCPTYGRPEKSYSGLQN